MRSSIRGSSFHRSSYRPSSGWTTTQASPPKLSPNLKLSRSRTRPARFRWTLAFAAALSAAGVHPAAAHEGPPFPIIMDVRAGPYLVSVWTDPDIGEALFFVVLETPDGGLPPEPAAVSMWAEPIDGRLPRASYSGRRQTLRNRMQYELHPLFDERRQWRVGFQIRNADGRMEEVQAQVESTPPGWGPWDLLIYAFPFGLLGTLWIVAMVRQRHRRRRERGAG
jgi:hypothetical protein